MISGERWMVDRRVSKFLNTILSSVRFLYMRVRFLPKSEGSILFLLANLL